jgi:hypothetical protein
MERFGEPGFSRRIFLTRSESKEDLLVELHPQLCKSLNFPDILYCEALNALKVHIWPWNNCSKAIS